MLLLGTMIHSLDVDLLDLVLGLRIERLALFEPPNLVGRSLEILLTIITLLAITPATLGFAHSRWHGCSFVLMVNRSMLQTK